jgi:hypothetical protein
MLFSPQMAHLLDDTPRRRHTPAAPRRRRELLRGLRIPRRSKRAVAAGRLLNRPQPR